MNFLLPDGTSTGDAVVFWILAAMVAFFAVFTITRKNPVTAVMSLVAIVGGVVISRSHQKEVAANVAADYRKQIHELASHDYPGVAEEPAPEGHH